MQAEIDILIVAAAVAFRQHAADGVETVPSDVEAEAYAARKIDRLTGIDAGRVTVKPRDHSGIRQLIRLERSWKARELAIVGERRDGTDVCGGMRGLPKPLDEAVGDDGIGIEQDDVAGGYLAKRPIDGAGKTEICIIPQDLQIPAPRKSIKQLTDLRIGRRIVNKDDAMRAAELAQQAVEASLGCRRVGINRNDDCNRCCGIGDARPAPGDKLVRLRDLQSRDRLMVLVDRHRPHAVRCRRTKRKVRGDIGLAGKGMVGINFENEFPVVRACDDDAKLLVAVPGRPTFDQVVMQLDSRNRGLTVAAEEIDRLIERPHIALAFNKPARRTEPLLVVTPRQHPPVGRDVVGCDIQCGHKVGDCGYAVAHAKQRVGPQHVAVTLRQRPDPAAAVCQTKGGRDITARERQRAAHLELLMVR